MKKRILNYPKKYISLRKQAENLVEISKSSSDNFDQLIKNVKVFKDFNPSQNDNEIRHLLEIIKQQQFRTICEIGSYKGGTLFLLCQAATDNSRIISIDIKYPLYRKRAYRNFKKGNQKLFCITGDTKSTLTYYKTKIALSGRQIDFLFIDGNHSFFGVMNDYIRFSPLVKQGGIIAFHDICPDQYLRNGVKTSSYVGGVPFFWEALKKSGVRTKEIIEDPSQDGFGIGILYK